MRINKRITKKLLKELKIKNPFFINGDYFKFITEEQIYLGLTNAGLLNKEQQIKAKEKNLADKLVGTVIPIKHYKDYSIGYRLRSSDGESSSDYISKSQKHKIKPPYIIEAYEWYHRDKRIWDKDGEIKEDLKIWKDVVKKVMQNI